MWDAGVDLLVGVLELCADCHGGCLVGRADLCVRSVSEGGEERKETEKGMFVGEKVWILWSVEKLLRTVPTYERFTCLSVVGQRAPFLQISTAPPRLPFDSPLH
jgi:hypothetical protein